MDGPWLTLQGLILSLWEHMILHNADIMASVQNFLPFLMNSLPSLSYSIPYFLPHFDTFFSGFSRSQVMASSFTFMLHFLPSGKSFVTVTSLITHLLASQNLFFPNYSYGKNSQFSLTWIPKNLASWRTPYSHSWHFFLNKDKSNSQSVCHLSFIFL